MSVLLYFPSTYQYHSPHYTRGLLLKSVRPYQRVNPFANHPISNLSATSYTPFYSYMLSIVIFQYKESHLSFTVKFHLVVISYGSYISFCHYLRVIHFHKFVIFYFCTLLYPWLHCFFKSLF